MKKIDYQIVKIYIINNNKIKLETGLKITSILSDTWSISCIESIIFVFENSDFVQFKIKIITKKDKRAKILFVLRRYFFFLI